MLLIDGVKYELWMPPNEDAIEQMVKEHAQDIFGEQSIYLDMKPKLRSRSGIGSIPDGYVIVFEGSPCWHIVEVELSSHPLHEHIVSQLGKFISGIKNYHTQKEIVDAMYEEIAKDDFRKLKVRKAIKSDEIHRFLADLISKKLPVLTIIIEKHTEELDEALSALAHPQIKVVELQTFTREGVGLGVHAHLFEPLFRPFTLGVKPEGIESPEQLQRLEHILKDNELKYRRLKISANEASFFPSFGEKFQMETDMDVFKTHVTDQNPPRIRYITKWFNAHPELKAGDKLVIEVVEPMKKYSLRKA